MMSMYSHQKNPALDKILLHGRTRFGESVLVSRQDGLRPVIRGLRKGIAFFTCLTWISARRIRCSCLSSACPRRR